MLALIKIRKIPCGQMQPTHPASPLGGARPLSFDAGRSRAVQSWHESCMGIQGGTV